MESWKILFLMEVVTLIKKSIENRVFMCTHIEVKNMKWLIAAQWQYTHVKQGAIPLVYFLERFSYNSKNKYMLINCLMNENN